MRKSREEPARTRRRIVETAAVEFPPWGYREYRSCRRHGRCRPHAGGGSTDISTPRSRWSKNPWAIHSMPCVPPFKARWTAARGPPPCWRQSSSTCPWSTGIALPAVHSYLWVASWRARPSRAQHRHGRLPEPGGGHRAKFTEAGARSREKRGHDHRLYDDRRHDDCQADRGQTSLGVRPHSGQEQPVRAGSTGLSRISPGPSCPP